MGVPIVVEIFLAAAPRIGVGLCVALSLWKDDELYLEEYNVECFDASPRVMAALAFCCCFSSSCPLLRSEQESVW